MAELVPDELRAVFRLSLKSQKHIISALNDGTQHKDPPVLRDLIEAILFSRRFVPTYMAVLLVLILVHGVVKNIRWNFTARRSKYECNDQFCREVRSSSSSATSRTLDVTDNPTNKGVEFDEQMYLLPKAGSKYRRSFSKRIWARIQSLRLWQPRPIPALTAQHNTLPENETSIVILLFLALNLVYLLYHFNTSRYAAFALADRAGLLFVANLPVLYLLAAKNNQPLQWFTGWSYEGLNIFHRRLGEWMTIMAVIHFTGMLISYYQLLAPAGLSLGWYLTRKIIIFGWIGGIMYLLIYITSVGYFRQQFYEMFLASHIFLQITALVMIFLHHHNARLYVVAAAAIWMSDRIAMRMLMKPQSLVANLEVAPDGQTVLLHCDIPVSNSKLPAWGINRGWHAGQHVFLSVPGISRKHRTQAHPFTIASPAPGSGSGAVPWPLLLVIRAQDGFSRELLEYAKLHQHTVIRLDGPYSSDDVLQTMQSSQRICLIAGGSGIAVTYPLAVASQTHLVTAEDLVHDRARYVDGRKVLPNIRRSVCPNAGVKFAHLWVRQDPRHERWIRLLPRTSTSTSEEQTVYDLITDRFETRQGGRAERPDMQVELRTWVQQSNDTSQDICVIVSGPDGLVRDVRNAVADLVREGWKIGVSVEKFGW